MENPKILLIERARVGGGKQEWRVTYESNRHPLLLVYDTDLNNAIATFAANLLLVATPLLEKYEQDHK